MQVGRADKERIDRQRIGILRGGRLPIAEGDPRRTAYEANICREVIIVIDRGKDRRRSRTVNGVAGRTRGLSIRENVVLYIECTGRRDTGRDIQRRRRARALVRVHIDRVVVELVARRTGRVEVDTKAVAQNGRRTERRDIGHRVVGDRHIGGSRRRGDVDTVGTRSARTVVANVADDVIDDRTAVDGKGKLNSAHRGGRRRSGRDAGYGVAVDDKVLDVADQHTAERVLVGRNGRSERVSGDIPVLVERGRTLVVDAVLNAIHPVVLDRRIRVWRLSRTTKRHAAARDDTSDNGRRRIAREIGVLDRRADSTVCGTRRLDPDDRTAGVAVGDGQTAVTAARQRTVDRDIIGSEEFDKAKRRTVTRDGTRSTARFDRQAKAARQLVELDRTGLGRQVSRDVGRHIACRTEGVKCVKQTARIGQRRKRSAGADRVRAVERIENVERASGRVIARIAVARRDQCRRRVAARRREGRGRREGNGR